MNDDLEYIELIEQYLKGRLSSAKMAELAEREKSDAAFHDQVNAYRRVNQLLIEAQILQKRKNLGAFIERKRKGRQRWKWGFGGVASIILLAGGIMLFSNQDKVSDQGFVEEKSKLTQEIEPIEKVSAKEESLQKIEKNKKESSQVIELKDDGNLKQLNKIDSVILPKDSIKINSPDSIETKDKSQLNKEAIKENVVKNETHTAKEQAVKCDKFKYKIQLKQPCYGKANGEIRIRSSQHDWLYSIDDDPLDEYAEFLELEDGEYKIVMKDRDQCKDSTIITLSEQLCIESEYVVSRIADQTLEIDLNESPGRITILDRTGVKIYEAIFNENGVNWNLTSNTGMPVKMGFYPIIIQLENGTILKTGVTILD